MTFSFFSQKRFLSNIVDSDIYCYIKTHHLEIKDKTLIVLILTKKYVVFFFKKTSGTFAMFFDGYLL